MPAGAVGFWLLLTIGVGVERSTLFLTSDDGILWTVLAKVGGLEVTGLAMLLEGALSF